MSMALKPDILSDTYICLPPSLVLADPQGITVCPCSPLGRKDSGMPKHAYHITGQKWD